MNKILQLKPHPFRLLLYIEWILAVITVINDLPWEDLPYLKTLVGESPDGSELSLLSWVLTILCLILLGLMGLRLPTGTIGGKCIYTAIQLGLIWLGTALGSVNFPLETPYFIVIIRSCLIFKPKQRILISALVFISFLLLVTFFLQDIQTLQAALTKPRFVSLEKVKMLSLFITINSTFWFGLVSIFILMLVNALISERESKQELALARDRLAQYALLIEDRATLQERNRIAREIHDSIGHALTAQSIQLENALLFYDSNPDRTKAFLNQAKQLVATALKDIRHSVSTLRSNPLQGKRLTDAIASLIEDFQATTNIIPDVTINLESSLTPEIKTAVYRIVQESLTNIAKHGDASTVIVKLTIEDRSLKLAIEDNGKGFNPEQNTTGFGLQGMRERTLALGGQFNINSAPGSGCKITADITLPGFAPI